MLKLPEEWIAVDGYKNVPKGEWLVLVRAKNGAVTMQACTRRENGYCKIGHIFGFDEDPVIAYAPQPSFPASFLTKQVAS